MEALLAIAIGVLTGAGVFLMLRARTFPVLLGLTLLSYAVNLFLFVSGAWSWRARRSLTSASPPTRTRFRSAGAHGHRHRLRMTALLVVLALRAIRDTGDDHVDGAGGDASRHPAILLPLIAGSVLLLAEKLGTGARRAIALAARLHCCRWRCSC